MTGAQASVLPPVQLMHVEFVGEDEVSAGGYWLARWSCDDCGARGELAGARIGVDGVPLRQRGHEHARRHRCDLDREPQRREAAA